jgi:hypothetical protein
MRILALVLPLLAPITAMAEPVSITFPANYTVTTPLFPGLIASGTVVTGNIALGVNFTVEATSTCNDGLSAGPNPATGMTGPLTLTPGPGAATVISVVPTTTHVDTQLVTYHYEDFTNSQLNRTASR